MADRYTHDYTNNKIQLTGFIEKILVLVFVSIFTLLSIGSAIRESLTFDEIVDVEDGLNAIDKRDFSVNPYNPPLIQEISVIPIKIGFDKYLPNSLPNLRRFPERMMVTLLGVIFFISLYIFTKKYLGKKVALTTLFFITFEPTVLGHSHYITLDTGTTLFFFLSIWTFIEIAESYKFANYILFGISSGLLFASRVFGITYLIGSLIFGLIFTFRNTLRKVINFKIVISAIISLLIIWSVYLFKVNVLIAPSSRQNRFSDRVVKYSQQYKIPLVTELVFFLKKQPLPLGNYGALVKNSILRSSQSNQLSTLSMPVVLGLKLPIPLLFFVFSGYLILLFKKNKNSVVTFIMILPLSILIISMTTNMNPLIRYLMPSIPFLCIIASVGFLKMCRNRWGFVISIVIAIWYVVGSVNSFPHFISYSNEISLILGNKYEIFSDSNLDWGQGLVSLNSYIDKAKPSFIQISYFGRDDASRYGFESKILYGSYKQAEICSFHPVIFKTNKVKLLTVISVSNWNDCGYRKMKQFSGRMIKDIVADTFLIF
jgi:hypothetical protein